MDKHKNTTDPSMEIPKIDMKDVDFGGAFKQFLEVVKLNKKVMESVAGNAKGGAQALIFLVAGAVAAPLGYVLFWRMAIVPVLVQAVFAVLVAAAVIFVTTMVANKLFKGKGSFAEYFRVAGLAYALNVLMLLGLAVPALLPLIGLVVGVWSLVVNFYAIQTVFKLDNTNTVLTIIVSVVAMVVLGAIVASLGFGAAYGSFGMQSFMVRY